MRRILVSASLAFAACGPATAPPGSGTPGQMPNQVIMGNDAVLVNTSAVVRVVSQDVAAPVDRVWAVLPAVYQELGLGASADPARRTVSGTASLTRRFQGEQAVRFFDCGLGQFGTPIAATYTIRLTLSTTVNSDDAGSGSRLATMVEANARSNDGANAVGAQCRSAGRLEEMIAARVRAKLGT